MVQATLISTCVSEQSSRFFLPKNAVTQAQDFMQAGTQQVAAGYVLYGPSTMMALTVGNGVAFFTLDPETQTFLLTTENVQVSADTQEFAINASNQRHWEQPVKQYIEELLAGKTSVREKTSICVGSHVWWVMFTVFYVVAVFSFIHMT